MSIVDIDISDPTPTKSSVGFFRAEEGHIYRIAVVYFHDEGLTRVKFRKANVVHSGQTGLIVSRLGEDGPDADDLVWKTFGEAREKYSTAVLRYPTLPNGTPDKDNPKNWDVLVWDFSAGTFEQLKSCGSKLGEIDLKVRCTSAQYQRLKIESCGPAFWRQPKSEPFKDKVFARLKEIEPRIRPAREMTTAEAAAALGVAWPPSMASDIDDVQAAFLDETGSV